MKDFLVDVPVRVNIWIRPECQRKQFEILKQARPSIMFLQSDGGRNEEEWEAIYANRKIFDEEIDWNCTVYKLYEDKNNGLYTMGRKTAQLIWSTVDRCIFLEDDVLPSVSFFRYCAELLEKYKDDTRISCICGMNHLGVYDAPSADYFFSRQGSVWGTATWKRNFDLRRGIEYADDEYAMKLLKQRTRHNKAMWNRIVGYTKNDYYGGHVPGGEFYGEFAMYAHNQVKIIPKKNMICNIGCTENSAHALALNRLPHGLRRVYNMKTYELEGEIKHPKYVMPDVEYEEKRNRIMAYNKPLIALGRRFQGTWARITADGFGVWLKRQFKRVFGKNKKKNIET